MTEFHEGRKVLLWLISSQQIAALAGVIIGWLVFHTVDLINTLATRFH